MKEKTIAYNLDHAKTPKEKRAAYNDVRKRLQNKGEIVDAVLLSCNCRQFSILKYFLDNVIILLEIIYTIESIVSNISNMRRSVSSPDETPRRELKIRRAAEYF